MKEEIIGLTDKEVKERQEKHLVNYDTTVPTKSIKKILLDNIFTLFNFLNLFLGLAIFLVGSYKNMLFLGVAIINTIISTIQEIHAKRVIDKLSIMSSSKAKVIRNGNKKEISINDLVLDDVVELSTGDQVVVDSIILDGEAYINESFITGEPDTILKNKNDVILSGSYIVSGKCIVKVNHVGEENYTAKISNGAKYVKKINSEIMKYLNKIIRFLTFIILPLGLAMFYTQLNIEGMTFKETVVKSVASIISMIPEGLVLLTSTVLAVSVIRLSKKNVLVQELYCIETLARVDTLCLDKTGTLTEAIMEVKDFIPITKSKEEISNILSNLAKASEDENSSIDAIKKYFTDIKNEFIPINKMAFSSEKKWSGIYFKDIGSYIIGAPEIVLQEQFSKYKDIINNYSKDYRVIALIHSKEDIKKELPHDIELVGFILILDKIRKEAKSTIKYFEKQDVDIKIMSGDNPITVSKIAKQLNIKDYEKYIDMSKVADRDIDKVASKYTIFGRVSPIQKKELIMSLKKAGRTVAMTGDGVNDVLALKEADCSIAMSNGSDATKNVSQLILLDSKFSSMPRIVAEGRRTINNIQRSATLFLVKSIYSVMLAIMFLFMKEEYPFIPIQLTLISVITIGIPSFILALEPNRERVSGNFMKNIIMRAFPTGIAVALSIFTIAMLNKEGIIPEEYYSSLCVIATGFCGIILLFIMSRTRKGEKTKLPVSIFRLLLAIILTIIFIIGITVFKDVFNIVPINDIINILKR